MPSEPYRAIGYLRCSTDEQADSGAGLEVQRASITAEAARRGWLLEFAVDAGCGAGDLKRPAVQGALEALEAGEADVLVVSNLDRLSRSLLDFATLMARSRTQGWAIVCLDANVDTSTPSGELMANVLASFAQFERRLIGERTKRALAIKKAQGVRLGRPPEVSESAVERIRAGKAQGMSNRAIAADLTAAAIPTARGGNQWWPETVRTIVKREELH